ncbi:MAG: hypothetical protein EXX96DRAFT_549805 [Benjaminiella poitrasii]|nr:MAG: hypothetical protein EXX96DRAFT_549805 [Benjaminiella poitrasii]
MKFTVFSSILIIALALLIQVTVADISELQFIKIKSPTNGQKIKAGEKVLIKYVMQPLVFKHTSNGYAKSLNITFHETNGNTEQVDTVCSKCSVKAKTNKYKAYSRHWTVPESLKAGNYSFEFTEDTQLRRGRMTITETVKVNVEN